MLHLIAVELNVGFPCLAAVRRAAGFPVSYIAPKKNPHPNPLPNYRSDGEIAHNLPMQRLKLLFLCTGNSCRSQMAEGWARHLKSDCVEAYSAGVSPHGMNALAIRAMSEVGVDITRQHSKHIDELKNIDFDFVITVCDHANETCPILPGKARKIHVGLDDPPRLAKDAQNEDEAMRHYRRVRDEIRVFIESLPASLLRENVKASR